MSTRTITPISDAVTDSDARAPIIPIHHTRAHHDGRERVCDARARIPFIGTVRHCPSLRHWTVEASGEWGSRLEELANCVRRLVPSHRDPEAFHEAKSEIEAELRHLARVLPLPRPTGRAERETLPDGADLAAKVPGLRKG